jgi:hypothetical protein
MELKYTITLKRKVITASTLNEFIKKVEEFTEKDEKVSMITAYVAVDKLS